MKLRAPLPAAFAAFAIAATVASAVPLKFAGVLTSHAVIQRDVAAPVWGFGEPGKVVAISLNGKPVGEATVAGNGRWIVNLPAQQANLHARVVHLLP